MSNDNKNVLDQLDKLPKIRQFDAFPKTSAVYTQRSARGGLLTVVIALCLLIMAWSEAKDYFYGKHGYSFDVNRDIGQHMQINFDVTVAMKCHFLTVDVRDAVGDRLHVSDIDLKKDGTTFELGHAQRLDSLPTRHVGIGATIGQSKKKNKGATFSRDNRPLQQKHFRKTDHVVPDGPACRIYGSILAKRVTGNLHVTTLGHGYWSMEHTDHQLMNLSHVVHELSFGPYFPEIVQPLDTSVEISPEHFAVFEYFVSIIPTRFIDSWGRTLLTNQYSVNDYVRTVEHGIGVPGIFFKYDLEPFIMTVRERTVTLTQFLVRLAGILGGVWVCAGYGYRIGDRMLRVVTKLRTENEPSYEEYAKSYSSSYATRPSNQAGIYRGPSSYAGSQWTSSTVTNSMRNPFGMGHRPTASVQQRIDSEEGKAPW